MMYGYGYIQLDLHGRFCQLVYEKKVYFCIQFESMNENDMSGGDLMESLQHDFLPMQVVRVISLYMYD